MSSMVDKITNHLQNDSILHISSSIMTGAVSWLGSSVTKVGFLGGTGFGFVALATSSLAYKAFKAIGINNKGLNLLLSGTFGGTVAYSVLLAAGAPVSVPAAVALTVIALATKLLSIHIAIHCSDQGFTFLQTDRVTEFKIS